MRRGPHLGTATQDASENSLSLTYSGQMARDRCYHHVRTAVLQYVQSSYTGP